METALTSQNKITLSRKTKKDRHRENYWRDYYQTNPTRKEYSKDYMRMRRLIADYFSPFSVVNKKSFTGTHNIASKKNNKEVFFSPKTK
ncbi:hypothetical protein [endosymbiont GvMRE of Glomus versiforme]|uniref:hypothetical protein n=1 Tax=endosymbiont GvMRE of Glomus versiforme TaxID=2039283 RepID=UPI0011C388C9|nr:hypothetical protein [endosymbiont GvMRE of Glomus versiforme]